MLQLPVAVVPTGNVTDRAVAISYTREGQRLVIVSDTNGAFTDSAFAVIAPLGLSVRPAGKPTSPTVRAVNIPGAGAAEAP